MAEAHMNDTQASPRTPLVGQDRKLDIIEHVNNDHLDKILAVVGVLLIGEERLALLYPVPHLHHHCRLQAEILVLEPASLATE